jgi:hypothetical protein
MGQPGAVAPAAHACAAGPAQRAADARAAVAGAALIRLDRSVLRARQKNRKKKRQK